MITDLPDIIAPPKWTRDAKCASAEYDPDDWYPVQGEPDYEDRKARALAVCRRCPVQTQCLRDALANEKEIWGIRGNRTQHSRARLRTGRRRIMGRLRGKS